MSGGRGEREARRCRGLACFQSGPSQASDSPQDGARRRVPNWKIRALEPVETRASDLQQQLQDLKKEAERVPDLERRLQSAQEAQAKAEAATAEALAKLKDVQEDVSAENSDIQVASQPLIEFVDNPPEGHEGMKFKDHVMAICKSMPGVDLNDTHIQKCANKTVDVMHHEAAKLVGDEAMVAAVVLFTMMTSIDDSRNFDFKLNDHLRRREGAFLRAGQGYLWLIMSALSRLPAVSGIVYRGINRDKAQDALQKLKPGVSVHFSGFSSSSTDRGATEQYCGPYGVIMRFKLLETHSKARDIQQLSMFRNESEVLLLPNFKMFVDSIIEEGGRTVIELSERHENVQFDF